MIRQKMLQIIAIDSLFAEVKLCSSYVLLSQSFSRNKNVFKYFWVHLKYFFSVKQMNENRHQRLGMDKTRYDISKLPRLSWDSHLENLTYCFPSKIDSSLIPAFNKLRSEKRTILRFKIWNDKLFFPCFQTWLFQSVTFVVCENKWLFCFNFNHFFPDTKRAPGKQNNFMKHWRTCSKTISAFATAIIFLKVLIMI